MKIRIAIILTAFVLLGSLGWISQDQLWNSEQRTRYVLYFMNADKKEKEQYFSIFDKGIKDVERFTGGRYKSKFDIYVYPDRSAMDKQWSTDWKMPGFKSECWMVASGVGAKLDMLSPLKWKQEACEHDYASAGHTQRLLTHELFHVYHGQMNASKDFSVADTIDWFVEGFATYASGQCDTTRIRQVKNAIWFNQAPDSLTEFWTGKLKYGFSGSLVMYIDKKYGRKKLLQLLPYNKKQELLNALKTDEATLLVGWRKYMQELK